MKRFINYKNYGRLWRVYGSSLLRYGTPKKIWNALRTERAYRRRDTVVRSAPYILFLEPLYYCNLDCPLCDRQIFPDARPGKQAGRLSLEKFDEILDEVGDYLFQVQIFGQGEPLLDWARTQAIIKKSHERRIFTLLSTNCILLTERIVPELVASGLDHLVCAIDGVSQEAYGKYRVSGDVNKALAGMRRAVEEKRRQKSDIVIEWQFLVNRFNQHEIEDARKIAEELGVFLRFSPIRGMEFHEDLQEEWLAKDPQFAAAVQKPGESVYHWPCYFLWRSIVLNSNHKVARCLIYQNVAEYASLDEMSVMEAFNAPTIQRARQLFVEGPVPEGDFPSPCKNCSFYGRHHGGPNMDKHASLLRATKPAGLGMAPAAVAAPSAEALAARAELSDETPVEAGVEVRVFSGKV